MPARRIESLRILSAGCAVLALAACQTLAPPQASDQKPVPQVATSPPSPSPPQIAYGGGDGSSLESAITIHGAAGDLAATQAEYAWLRERYPGFGRGNQSLVTGGNGKFFDAIDIVLPGGEKRRVFFDISATFGK